MTNARGLALALLLSALAWVAAEPRPLTLGDSVIRGSDGQAALETPGAALLGFTVAKLALGFPISADPVAVPGFATLLAQGVLGSDFECAGSVLPGKCAYRSALDAANVCSWVTQCRGVTVYTRGLDGCSEEVAVLKSAVPAGDNYFTAPDVYTYAQVDADPLVGTYLHQGEAAVVVPPESELAAAAGEVGLNSTTWLGCIIGEHSLMGGDLVDALDGVESAEACCRLCREASGCTNWNYCPTQGGCRYQPDQGEPVELAHMACELRFQALVVPQLGWPPAVLAKGPGVAFTSGSPLVSVAPETPGYTRLLGSGLFGLRGYTCPGSIKPDLQECVKQSNLPSLADFCDADPECAAFVYKPAGVLMSPQGVAIFKHSANASAIILTPSAILYTRDDQSSASLQSADASQALPPGAIAGIAVGAAAAAAACGAAAALLWRRLQRRLQQLQLAASKAADSALENGEHGVVPVLLQPDSSKPPSGSRPTSTRSSSPPATAAPAPEVDAAGDGAAAACAPAAAPAGGFSLARAQSRAARRPPVSVVPQRAVSFPAVGGFQSGNGGAATPSPFASPFAAGAQEKFPSPEASAAGPAATGAFASRVASIAAERGAEQPIPELVAHAAQLEGAREAQASVADVLPGSSVLPSLPLELQEWVFDPSRIRFLQNPNDKLQELGAGGWGSVFKAVFMGEIVAVKAVDLGRSEDAQASFVREASRLQLLRHPNVVGFFGVSLDGGTGLIIMEYAEGHDLCSALNLQPSGRAQRSFGWHGRGRRVLYDIAKALNYLHNKGVVHMDVKSSNVLLTAGGMAKLGDVGLSRMLHHTFLSDVAAVGTFAWAAPEVLLGGTQCTSAVDIYSFGVLMWEVITGERPMRGRLRMPQVPEECPQEACDLMLRCMSHSPPERPTALELLDALHRMVLEDDDCTLSPQAGSGVASPPRAS